MLYNPENMCHRCNGHIIFDEYAGEKFCTNCGFVHESRMVDQSHKDTISNDVTKKNSQEHHYSANPNHHDGCMGSIVLYPNSDHSGKKLSANQKILSNNIKKWTERNRVITPSERRLVNYFQKIQSIRDILNLSDGFVSRLLLMIRRAEKARLLESKRVDVAVLALIYITGKIANQPISHKKLKKIFNIQSRSFNKYSNEFTCYLKIDPREIITKVEFVFEKLCSDLGVPLNLRKCCRKTMQYCKENDIGMQKTNSVIAASVIHTIYRHYKFTSLSLERISKVADISEESITTNSRPIKDILKYMNIPEPKRKESVTAKRNKTRKNNKAKPMCPDCSNTMIKVGGEGYDILGKDHVKFVFGRICKRCKKIYINPEFCEYSITQTSDKLAKKLFVAP